MGKPVVNNDGTVQVGTPTMSAFAPQAGGGSAPPPPAAAPAPPQTASFPAALLEMIQHLVQALKPGAAGNASGPARVEQEINKADPAPAPAPGALGSQFGK